MYLITFHWNKHQLSYILYVLRKNNDDISKDSKKKEVANFIRISLKNEGGKKSFQIK